MQESFGVEIEYYNHDRDEISGPIYLAAKIAEITTKAKHSVSFQENKNKWTAKTDPSCGYELTTPVLEINKENLNYFIEFTSVVNSYVKKSKIGTSDYSAGIHVHLGRNMKNDKKFINLIAQFEKGLFQCNPKRTREYCYRVKDYVEDDNNYIPTSHSDGINVRRRTYEIRYGQSTLNNTRIKKWLVLLFKLYFIAKNIDEFTINNSIKGDKSEMFKFIKKNNNLIPSWLKPLSHKL